MSENASAVQNNQGTFNPLEVNSWVLYNEDYNIIPVKIRLNDTRDQTIDLGPKQSLVFNVKYLNNQASFIYQGAEVQMIDLNDGGKSDDFNAPNSNDNDYNTLRYVESSREGHLDVINFNASTYVKDFEDRDGVAGGSKAEFRQAVQNNAIQCSISMPKRS
jgi:hypothetical protein